jgi:hypothetical protein
LYVNVQAGVQAVSGALQREHKRLETAGLLKRNRIGYHRYDRTNLVILVCDRLRFIVLKILGVNTMPQGENRACAPCVCGPDVTGR